MNKVAASVVLGVALAGAGTVQAASEQSQQVAECKLQLAAIYGEPARVRISGRAEGSESTLKFRVYPKGERMQRVSCTRTSDDAISLTDRFGVALVLPEQTGEALSAL